MPNLSCTTYVDSLLAALTRAGDRPVICHADGDLTGVAAIASIFRYARALQYLGIDRGAVVALWAPNVPEALTVRYAAHVLGAATTYLPDPTSEEERSDLLAQMAPQMLIVFAGTAHLMPADNVVEVASIGAPVPGALRLDALADLQASTVMRPAALPHDMAAIVASGGSTGRAKGSWRTFDGYAEMVAGPANPRRRQLVNGELAHLSQVLVDQTLLGGGTVVLADTCEPAPTLAAIEAHGITDLFLVEPQLADLIDHPDVPRRDLSTLQRVVHIGASAPPTLRRRARVVLGPVVVHTYGASEIGIVSRLGPAEHDLAHPERFTCAGRVVVGVDVRFRRADGSVAAPGEPGTIEVRSAAVAAGYRNLADAEAATFVDGWCRTGDVGRLDTEGYLHIVGRAVDLTVWDDSAATPTMVEDTLMCLPEVRYAAVSVDHATGRWIAATVPWPGASVDLGRCHRAIELAHGAEAATSVIVAPIDRLPLTGQGKPDHRRILALVS